MFDLSKEFKDIKLQNNFKKIENSLDIKQNEFWLQLPVSHCVPLNPGAQLQLNPFTWSVQVPLFSQG